MNIEVKCYATLAPLAPKDAAAFPVAEGETVGAVMERIGIAPKDVKLIFVNGAKAELDRPLTQGDRLGLFPAVGGG